MSFSHILNDRALTVADLPTVQDVQLLQGLKITHIISCGFPSGYFNDLRKQLKGRVKYMYIHVDDSPGANILQYFPKSAAFISNALKDKTSRVLVHCVHGQSRSCAVTVAYLMATRLQSTSPSSYTDEENERLLYDCYELVHTARPCMAINPGFVQQLEIYRRMLLRRREMVNNKSTNIHVLKKCTFRSNAHAFFRASRAKFELCDFGTLVSALHPSPNNLHHLEHGEKLFRCRKCRRALFTSLNIIQQLCPRKQLPESEYWLQSAGGKSYVARNGQTKDTPMPSLGYPCAAGIEEIGTIQIEPIDWMKPVMSNMAGKIMCPECHQKIGNFDLKADFCGSIRIVVSRLN